jgi:mRNA interferase RelE/StbE
VSYRIDLTTAAARQLRKLPRPARERVLQLVESLADDPRPHGARKLVGEECAWRIRAGDYRIIYEIFDNELTVTVVRAGHRRDVYDLR